MSLSLEKLLVMRIDRLEFKEFKMLVVRLNFLMF